VDEQQQEDEQLGAGKRCPGAGNAHRKEPGQRRDRGAARDLQHDGAVSLRDIQQGKSEYGGPDQARRQPVGFRPQRVVVHSPHRRHRVHHHLAVDRGRSVGR